MIQQLYNAKQFAKFQTIPILLVLLHTRVK